MASIPHSHGISVGDLLKSRSDTFLPLELLAGGQGEARLITGQHIQKTGLALAGFHDYLRPGRVLVFGESEIRFLESLDEESMSRALHPVMHLEIPCVVICGGLTPPQALVLACDRADVPLLRTDVATPSAIAKLSSVLEDSLSERTTIHGVLLDVFGLGVLITGESGIGKSESALDLIARGHRLVADDTVDVRRRSESTLVGTCPELTRYHMELRGLGIINVKELFGIACTRLSKQIEMAVQLERWDESREYDRLGLDDNFLEILGLRIPLIQMPVAPARNIAILVEVAARNQLLRARGHHTAHLLARRLEDQLRRTVVPPTVDGEDEDEDFQGGSR
jgi:HPr kinase/phosphorylase